jgi:GT2 family glycosyltransferase
MTMSAVISAIIVNYNAGELLRRCVDSLLNCPLEIEIIVVDNASRDGSLDALLGLPGVQILKNPANVGFATACNSGLRVSSAPFLLFLNPDCSFKPGVLAELLSAMETDRRVGMTAGVLTNVDGTEQAGGRRAIPTPWRSFVRAFGLGRFSDRWPRLFFDFHLHKQPLPDGPVEVEATSGACMMIRREAMQDVGEWDEGYFLHCEDLDLCMRFRQKGWKILFVPDVKIVHVRGVCGRTCPIFVEWHKHKGMIRFYRKFFRHQYPGVLWPIVVFGVWLHFVLVAGYRDTLWAARVCRGKA